MRLAIFGLSVSSTWGNGHATLWRALIDALAADGHTVTFYERDLPFYRPHRDLDRLVGAELRLYERWEDVRGEARRTLAEADAAIVTSYCPDALEATALIAESRVAVKAFYDLDSPVTLARVSDGKEVAWVGPDGYRPFDLVLSYAGGPALSALRNALGARRVVPLYGSVDPARYGPGRRDAALQSDFSYIGTYAADRQDRLERLFLAPARRIPERRFLIAGAQYPQDFPWAPNIFFVGHLPQGMHPDFYASGRLTLNITRADMAAVGWCPSGRLFEAAASGAAILSDVWPGLEHFFTPGEEILVAGTADDACAAIALDNAALARIGAAVRERALAEHTAAHRARELVAAIEGATAAATVLEKGSGLMAIGIVPAAGAGSRIQPLAFSKELLPVGARGDAPVRPRAVSEYIVERMAAGGARTICFVISPGKHDILQHHGSGDGPVRFVYAVQDAPRGLCDALFSALPLVSGDEPVMVGLPDTVWFPVDGLARLPDDRLAFLLFPVDRPEVFDAVLTDDGGAVREIRVKSPDPGTHWVWGAFKMPGGVFRKLAALWERRGREDEYFGTLVNAWLADGGQATGVRSGEAYVDVGTFDGYRTAIELLAAREVSSVLANDDRRAVAGSGTTGRATDAVTEAGE